MAIYVISLELSKNRNHDALWRQFLRWKCIALTKSVWLAELVGPATAIHDQLADHLSREDKLLIFEINYGSQWLVSSVDGRVKTWVAAKVGPQ